MPLRDILAPKLVSCAPGTTVLDVARMMKANDVGSVLVLKDNKPVGIVTDRDIVLRCVSDGASLDSRVETIMTKTVEFATEDEGIQDVITHMKNRRIRRLPVVNRNGEAIGLISFGDIIGLLAKEMSDLSFETPLKTAA